MDKYNTEILKVNYDLIEKNNIDGLMRDPAVKKAVDLLTQGQIVAFPTETVYGLGADAANEGAVEKIYLAKGRPQDNPLIVHIATFQQLDNIIEGELSSMTRKMIEKFWPGPLTIIFNKTELIPAKTTAGLDSVAVRMPSHPLTRALIRTAGFPIAAPSANRSGAPSPTRASHVIDDLQGKIPLVLDGGSAWVGVESTVVDMRNDNLRILRPGGITKEEIEKVFGDEVIINNIDKRNIINGNNVMEDNIGREHLSSDIVQVNKMEKPISPGMKYRHYSPETPLHIIKNEQALRKLIGKGVGKKIGVVLSDESYNKYFSYLKNAHLIKMGSRSRPDIIASNLFGLLRRLDELSLEYVYIEAIPEEGIGQAVMNRLYKASSRE